MAHFVSGGYYLARRGPRGVVSASGCLSAFFPDDWAIAWTSLTPARRDGAAADFGIAPERLPAVTEWATEEFAQTFGWPNAFYTLEAAREARTKLPAEVPGLSLFGLGLHKSDVDGFLAAARPPEPQPGYAPVGGSGVYECVKEREALAEGGEPAGFELLATHSGLLTCSWLCNGLDALCAKELGIATNSRELLPDYPAAARCAEHISREEVGAEPGLWLPWLISIYAEW